MKNLFSLSNQSKPVLGTVLFFSFFFFLKILQFPGYWLILCCFLFLFTCFSCLQFPCLLCSRKSNSTLQWIEEASLAYKERLRTSHDVFLESLLQKDTYSKLYSYTHLLNGFAVNVQSKEVLLRTRTYLLHPSHIKAYKGLLTGPNIERNETFCRSSELWRTQPELELSMKTSK